MKKVSLLHTVKSVYETFADELVSAYGKPLEVDNAVDEFLVTNAQKKGFFPPENKRRLYLDLLAISQGEPDLLIVTCSSLTPFISEFKKDFDFPILSIDEEMCRRAALAGGNIAVLATAPTTVKPTVERIEAELSAIGKDGVVTSFLDAEAMTLLKAGDGLGHDARIADIARKAVDADVLVLAQASMARSEHLVSEVTGKLVLSSPKTCIDKALELLF